MFNVRLFRAILVTATLAFWLAGTNHCRLEQLPGMQFLACAPADCALDGHGGDSDCGGHEDSGCAEDGCADDSCAVVEGAVYQTGLLRIKADLPLVVVDCPVAASSAWLALEPVPDQQALPSADSPPEIPRLWQFFERAAASPRAPSLLA